MPYYYTGTATESPTTLHKTMMTLTEIEHLAFSAEEAHRQLTEEVTILNHELKKVAEAHRKVIAGAMRKARAANGKLAAAVEENPELFVKPKTRVINGMKIGFVKAQDALIIPNEEATIERIREKLADQATLLIKTEESVVKAALKQLSPEQLLEIGVLVEVGTDELVCTAVKGDVEKLVASLVKASKEKATAEPEA